MAKKPIPKELDLLIQETYVWKQGMANWEFAAFMNAVPHMPGMSPMPGM